MYGRTVSINGLIEKSAGFDSEKHDHVVPIASVQFDSEARLLVNDANPFGNVAPLEITQHALEQVFTKTARAVYPAGSSKSLPSDYLTRVPKDLLATILNRHITDLPSAANRRWMVRGYRQTARAVLDGNYPAKPGNTEILTMVADALESGGLNIDEAVFFRSDVTPDDLYLKSVFATLNTNDGEYGVGVCITNGEIGNRRLTVEPLIQRGRCTNTITVDLDGWSIRQVHAGYHWAEMKVLLRSAINRALRSSGVLVERLLAADADEIPSFADVLAGMKRDHGWDDGMFATVMTGTEGRTTRAGIVNGITYAAHRLYGDDPATMHDMERLGGAILLAPGSLFAEAAKRVNRRGYDAAADDWQEYLRADRARQVAAMRRDA